METIWQCYSLFFNRILNIGEIRSYFKVSFKISTRNPQEGRVRVVGLIPTRVYEHTIEEKEKNKIKLK